MGNGAGEFVRRIRVRHRGTQLDGKGVEVVWQIIALAMTALAVLSTAFAIHFYKELFKWARECQSAQIAIAWKGKVTVVAPLVEWMLWSRQLSGKEENGRVVYHNGGTRVALIKRRKQSKKRMSVKNTLTSMFGLRGGSTTSTPTPKQGTAVARDDKTGRKQVLK